MDLWCIYIPLPLFWQAQKSQPLMRMLAMCFSNGRQNPNNVYWEHIFCQISDNIYWEHIFCQNPNNVYWEHNKWSPESQQCLLRTQQIHGACEYTVDKYSTARNWWQNWLKFCCPVKLFVRKASPLAYVSFSQQSTAEKHLVCLSCTMVTFTLQAPHHSTFFWGRKKGIRKSFPICWQKFPLMANLTMPIAEKVNQIISRRNTFDLDPSKLK